MLPHPLLPLAALASIAAPLAAQLSLVAPPGYAAAEGNANNAFPWNRGAASMRIQFVHDSTVFTSQGVSTPIVITSLRYRPDAGATTISWAGGSWPNVRIDMATCTSDYLSVSSAFAANLGPNLTNVLQGPVTVQPGAGLGAGVTLPFYIDIPLTTPFVYDPAGGDLVVDIQLDGTGWTGTSRAADHVSLAANNPLGSRVYNTTGLGATTGTVGLQYAPVVEFGYQPASGLFAAFNATPTTGASPLTVQFTDGSFSSAPGGVTGWAWDLDGDGTTDSTQQNPSFTYTGCGDFTVRLTVTDATQQNTLTRTALVRTDEFEVDFTATPIGGGSWQLTGNATLAATGWAWDIDADGTIEATTSTATLNLGNDCSRTIRLTATRNCRSAQTQRTVLLAPAVHSANLTAGIGTLATPSVGNLFDLQVTAPEGVLVCGLTSATYTGVGPYTASVYITPGSYVGKDSNPALWRLVGSGLGQMGGGTITAPSLNEIALSTPFYLPQGDYGVAVFHTSTSGSSYIAYTNASSGPFAGTDLVFHPAPATAPGIAKTNLFGTGGILTPRQWNGSFHYTKVTLNGQGGYGTFGLGCAGTAGVPSNRALSQPRLGRQLSVELGNLAQNLCLYWWGASNSVSGFGPLPLDLAPLGASSCFLRVSLDASVGLVGIGGTATFNFVLPLTPTLVGTQLYAQGASFDPAANAFGFVTSDAAGFVLGQ
ncbi:MAG: PKD domain-containing protein [Planctomycetes bacterium]|jgi:PKD repeat protein|nr:PKD domain-containing protein [Planctomycetota bacterium]